MWVGVICPDGGLITLGETMEKKMEKFKTWHLMYMADLVSTHHLNETMLHEIISKALQDKAGSIGYLIGDDVTKFIGDENE